MTVETVPGTDLKYYLVSYDKKGRERNDDPDARSGRLSDTLLDILKSEPITDVFLISHGWKGDIPAAKIQYDSWIGAMFQCSDDRDKIRQARPGFQSLLVGLHWPSLPWGDETQQSEVSFSLSTNGERSIDELIEDAADKISDTARAKEALRVIFSAALDDMEPTRLPDNVVDAYNALLAEADLGADGPEGAPGDDAEAFDPEAAYQEAIAEEALSFGVGAVIGGLLSPLRQLSFWKMKKRARIVGETGAGNILRQLQQSVPAERDVRFHLMGHSFGCIVVSATIAGAGGNAPLSKPVDSVYLVQGAFSVWSYCSDIPVARGKPGYFHSIPHDQKVSGPVLTTQSIHDTAVGKLYPIAAGVKGQVDYGPGELPKYGAVGSFGIRGPGVDVSDLAMRKADQDYEFEPGKVYNIESSEFICEGDGVSGAHSDIAKPEVAHAFWQSLMVAD